MCKAISGHGRCESVARSAARLRDMQVGLCGKAGVRAPRVRSAHSWGNEKGAVLHSG
jgi:hypothetical protein